MDTRELLNLVREGKISVEEAERELKDLPYKDLGYAKLDIHRKPVSYTHLDVYKRQGVRQVYIFSHAVYDVLLYYE